MKLPLIPGAGALKLVQADGILGGRIWPAASALCQYLGTILTSGEKASVRNCVELGSGTGAVGLYAAALGLPVTLTDHQPPLVAVMTSLPYSVDGALEVEEFTGDARSNRMLTLLQNNVDRNLKFFNHTPKVLELDWNNIEQAKQVAASSPCGVDLVLASDVTYSSPLHEPLAATISCLLASTNNANDSSAVPTKCLVSHEERFRNFRGDEDFDLASFQRALIKHGLAIVKTRPCPVVSENGWKHHKVCILEIQQSFQQ